MKDDKGFSDQFEGEWKIDTNNNNNNNLITLDEINNEYWYNYIQSKFFFEIII